MEAYELIEDISGVWVVEVGVLMGEDHLILATETEDRTI
jgi:hypothetical protein